MFTGKSRCNNIRSVILEIKTGDEKYLKYYYFVLYPENIFKVNKVNFKILFTLKMFLVKRTKY